MWLLMFILSAALFFEYRFFKEQARRAVELQDEYRMYTAVAKKIVDEYSNQKEEELETSEDGLEKKKN